MTPRFWFAGLLLTLLVPQYSRAQLSASSLQAVPWMGHKAALSLTFDGSKASYLDLVLPELNRRKLHATFFLVANQTDRKDEWRKALEEGNEIGNETLDAIHLQGISSYVMEAQVVGAQNVLQKEFGVPVLSFAYPFGEITPALKQCAQKIHLLSRGIGEGEFEINRKGEPDWMDLPSRLILNNTPLPVYRKWIQSDIQDQSWLILSFRDINETPADSAGVSKEHFQQLCDELPLKDLWIATFLEVGSYLKAENVFEKVKPEISQSSATWVWTLPPHFPRGTYLALRLNNNLIGVRTELWQGDHLLTVDAEGNYLANFDQKNVTLKIFPKN